MVRNRQSFETRRYRGLDELRSAIGPVGFVGMCVKIDQREMSPNSFSLAQTFPALASGVSLAEFTITSGCSGGS